MRTMNEIMADMESVFAGVCDTLGLTPIWTSLGEVCSVSLPSAEQAEDLVESLKIAGQTPRVHHTDCTKDKSFDADEWQVSWGDL